MQMILNFFSFHPRNFDSSISHLQADLQLMSSWMSANLLTLKQSQNNGVSPKFGVTQFYLQPEISEHTPP